MARFASSPNVGKDIIPAQLRGYLDDIKNAGGNLTYEQVRGLRSYVGEAMKNPGQIGNMTDGMWKQLYGSLSKDLDAFAANKGPEAALAYKRANQYYAAGRNRIDNALDFLMDKTAGNEGSFERLLSLGKDRGAKSNIQDLISVRRSMLPEEWDEVSGVIARQLGKPTAAQGGEFSATEFVKNWNNMAPAAKKMMFDTPTREALDSLGNVAESIKMWDQAKNHSNSATHGWAGVSLMGAMFATGKTATVLGGNFFLSKVLTSPTIINWLSVIPKIQNKATLANHVAKLDAIAHFNPEYADDLSKLKDAYASGTATANGPGRTLEEITFSFKNSS
jgi:hypothetical protein